MRLVLLSFALLVIAASPARAGFLETLSPAEKKALGLDQLTAVQAAAVDAAIEQYKGPADTKLLVQKAAAAAVAEYKATQEPAVVAQAVNIAKQKKDEERVDHFTTKIIGRFTGWGGKTLFALDNGQVWQQEGSEVYYLSPVENPEVEFRKAPSGHFRLYLPDGTWVTVKRLR